MKTKAYKTMKFKGHEVTVSGSVYKRDEKGALRRVKGRAAVAIRKGLAAQLRAEAAVMSDNMKKGKK